MQSNKLILFKIFINAIVIKSIKLVLIFICFFCFSSLCSSEDKSKKFEIFKLRYKADYPSAKKLFDYISDNNENVRKYAIDSYLYVLENINGKEIIPFLIDLYRNDGNIDIKNIARKRLIELKESGVFIKDLKSKDSRIQVSAAINLLEIDSADARNAIAMILSDDTEENRKINEVIAIEAGKKGIDNSLPILIKIYDKHAKKADVLFSVYMLAKNGNMKALEKLNELYGKSDFDTKKNIFRNLMESITIRKKFGSGFSASYGMIKFPWLSSVLLNEISELRGGNPVNTDKIRVYYTVLSYTEDKNAFLQASEIIKPYMKEIEEYSRGDFIYPVNYFVKRDLVDLTEIRGIINNIKSDMDAPNHEQINKLCRNTEYLLNEENKDIKEEIENFFFSILSKSWVSQSQKIVNEDRSTCTLFPVKSKIINTLIDLDNQKIINTIFENMGSSDKDERKEGYLYLTRMKNENGKNKAIEAFGKGLENEASDVLCVVINQIAGYINENNIKQMNTHISKLKQLVFSCQDSAIVTEIIKNLIKLYSYENNIIEVYFKLFEDKNEKIRNLAYRAFGNELAYNVKIMKQCADKLSKLTGIKKEEFLENLRLCFSNVNYFNFNNDFEKIKEDVNTMLDHNDKNEVQIALMSGSSALRSLCGNKALGKVFIILENKDDELWQTAVYSFACLCRFGRENMGEFWDNCLELLAEQYGTVASFEIKESILKDFLIRDHMNMIPTKIGNTNKKVRDVLETASRDSNPEIRKQAIFHLNYLKSGKSSRMGTGPEDY